MSDFIPEREEHVHDILESTVEFVDDGLLGLSVDLDLTGCRQVDLHERRIAVAILLEYPPGDG